MINHLIGPNPFRLSKETGENPMAQSGFGNAFNILSGGIGTPC
jgi:hypothetical protein